MGIDALQIAPLPPHPHPCGYLCGRDAVEQQFLVRHAGERAFEVLIENGFRHFGAHFFRPVCPNCDQCLPIRVCTADYRYPRSVRRCLKRNNDVAFELTRDPPDKAAWQLYLEHRTRFAEPHGQDNGLPFPQFREAFAATLPFTHALRMSVAGRLLAVTHLDVTSHLISAVYTYYAGDTAPRSPGTLAVCKDIEMAIEHEIPYVYLGYYIPASRHMNSKRRFRPNQLLVHGEWIDFILEDNTCNPDLKQYLPPTASGRK